MRATESFGYSNQGPGTYGPWALQGGTYEVSAHATFGGGNIAIQTLLPDNATWVPIGTSITADGVQNITVAPGQYRAVQTTSTAASLAITRVPLE